MKFRTKSFSSCCFIRCHLLDVSGSNVGLILYSKLPVISSFSSQAFQKFHNRLGVQALDFWILLLHSSTIIYLYILFILKKCDVL